MGGNGASGAAARLLRICAGGGVGKDVGVPVPGLGVGAPTPSPFSFSRLSVRGARAA